MNHTTRIACVLTALSLAAPFSAQAATEKEGLDSCAAALVAQIGEAQNSPVTYRLSKRSNGSGLQLRSNSTFYIDIVNPDNQEVVVRADCLVSSDGEIIKLEMLPPNALSARKRSAIS